MAKQLNVNLAMTADTSQVKSQLQQLQTQLQQVMNTSAKSQNFGITTEINKAITSAAELKIALQQATTSAGNLDLSKFSNALKNNNKSLKEYAADMASLGPTGSQAFAQIAQAVSQAEIPLRRSSTLLTEFATTLKNTARWQISSSILHSFMGSLQHAYGYAQDLNESLNSIRIVTGQSTEQMAAFAKRANESAQALSTTTTKYTDAALIFYQQGLSDDLVKEYTDVTIKMANVTGDGATEVSSYMTAIWNNFNKEGDQSAEHFGDVLTALGASTASSSAEIAAGLEKFASIAEVTGLSYDYAAASLATLVANTRQSADTVGTSLKTIFSRLEGVKLGETLEDGVGLNKYSEALQKIGVDILDASGEMKNLDDILDETASKWDNLTQAQKMATAQTVAGVRQYNNFISLMDNWDDMQTNVNTARNSDGELQKQADIYAESWEAARDRVKAAAEAIYSDLLDDKAFISVLNVVEKLLQGIDHIIDAMGGLGTIIPMIGLALTKVFSKDITTGLENSFHNLVISSQQGLEQIKNMRLEANEALKEAVSSDGASDQATVAVFSQKADLQTELINKTVELQNLGKEVNEADLQRAQLLMDINSKLGEEYIQLTQNAEKQNEILQTQIRQAEYALKKSGTGSEFKEQIQDAKELETAYAILRKIQTQYQTELKKGGTNIKQLREQTKAYVDALKDTGSVGEKSLDLIIKALKKAQSGSKDFTEEVNALGTACEDIGGKAFAAFGEAEATLTDAGMSAKDAQATMQGMIGTCDQIGASADNITQKFADFTTQGQHTSEVIGEIGAKAPTVAQGLTQAVSAGMSFAMALNAISNFGSTLFDDEASGIQKVVAGFMALTMAVQAFNAIRAAQKTLDEAIVALKAKENAITLKSIAAEKAHHVIESLKNLVKKKNIVATNAETAAIAANTAATATNAAAWWAHPIIAIIAAACLVLVGVLSAVSAAIQKNSEKVREHGKEMSEQVEKTKEQTDANKDLINSFNDAYKTYKETGIISEELKTATDDLTDAYGIQGGALAKLTGDYDDYIARLDAARKAEIAAAKAEAEDAVSATGQAFITDMREGVGNWDTAGEYNATFDSGWNSSTASQTDGRGTFTSSDEQAILEQWRDGDWNYIDYEYMGSELKLTNVGQDAESMAAAYAEVLEFTKQARANMSDADLQESEIYQSMMDWLEKSEDSYEAYMRNLELIQQYAVEESALDNLGDVSDISTVAEYNAKREELLDTIAQEQGIVDKNSQAYKDLASAVDTYLDSYDNLLELHNTKDAFSGLSDKTGVSVDDISDFYESLSDEDKTIFFNIDFDTFKTTESWEEQVQILQDLAANTQIQAGIDIQASTDQAILSKSGLKDKQREAVEEYYGDNVDWEAFDRANQSQQIEMIAEAQNQINKEVLETVENRKEDAEALQNELEAAQEYAEQTALAAQQTHDDRGIEYSEEYKKELEETARAAQEAVDVIQGQLDRLNDPIDWNDILLGTWDSAVNGLVDEMDAVANTTALIGENFQVAADDVRALVAEFPGILEGAEVAADGVITLNKDVVDNILAGKAAEIEADKEAAKEQLQSKIELLKAENECNQTKLDLINQFLAGEIDAKQLETDMTQAQTEFETKCLDIIGDTDAKLDIEAAQNNYQLTGTVLENLDQIGLRAQAVGEAIRAAMAGETVNYLAQGNTGSNNADINHDNYDAAADLNAEMEDFDQFYQNMQAQRDSLQAAIDANNQLIDGLEADVLKLEGGANDLLNRFNSVRNGGSGDGKASKNKSSSSKEKEKTTKDLKNLDDEIDRYHQIKELLEDIEAEVNKFSKAKDRAWGAGKIANINKEINALSKQKAALQEYQRQAKSYMSSDAAKAASYGWSIGADGNVSNYDANMAKITAEYNAAIAAYNGTEAGSDAEKAAGKNVEAAQKKFDEAKKALERYEESADLVRDLEQQIIDASYEIADLKLEAIEYTVELKLDFDERQLKLFEDIMKDFGDMADHALDKITEIEKCIGVIFDEMATNKNGISQMLGLAGVNGGTIASLINGGELTQGQAEEIAKKMQEENGDLNYDQIMSDIEGYMDELISLNDQLREYREQVFATLEAAIDEYIDDLDRANDKIAKITKLTQGYKDLIQSIGKANVDATGELTKALNKALEDEAKSAITAAKAKEDFAKTTLDDAKALYQTAVESGDEWAINRAEEVLKKAEDEYAEALEESQSATKAFVDAVATSFKDSIEQVITDLDKNLGGLKHLREQFDQSKELNAQYIEDYTKIYELSKLTRQVQSSMDETDNIRAKKELLEFQKEINAYQEQGVQMSEYELEYLQKRYELKLAEIALQEAQNAKSQVSMVQDNEGNYSYVYTADDQAVADAQQNYEDKLYALQLLNGQYINELQDNIITMQEEMSARLQEIADDETLSDEERIERIEETREYYLERLAFYDEQLALSLENNKSLYENEWLDYHEKTGYKISANKDYVDSWEETSIAILTNVKTQGEYMNMLQESLTQASNTAKDCCQESINKLNEVGLTTSNLTTIVNGATAQLTSDAQAIATGAQMMSAQYQSAINQIMASVQAFTAQYASMITQSIANNQRLIASMQMVIQMAAAMAAALGAHVGGGGGGVDPGSGGPGANPGNNNPGSNTPGNGQDPGSTSKTADAATIAGIAASIWMDGQKSGWGNDPIRSGKVTAEYNAATATAVQQYINQHGPNGDIYSQWAGNRDQLKQYYASYDTGGYTGAWGTSEGKLAMLHQKELVLNAADTSNMLAIVDMVRDISSMIDLNAMSSMINTGLSAVTANLNNEGTLEQEVHITAEFPNATDKNEILEAFDNVINLAAQYANRK